MEAKFYGTDERDDSSLNDDIEAAGAKEIEAWREQRRLAAELADRHQSRRDLSIRLVSFLKTPIGVVSSTVLVAAVIGFLVVAGSQVNVKDVTEGVATGQVEGMLDDCMANSEFRVGFDGQSAELLTNDLSKISCAAGKLLGDSNLSTELINYARPLGTFSYESERFALGTGFIQVTLGETSVKFKILR
jgi:hypothetical protein